MYGKKLLTRLVGGRRTATVALAVGMAVAGVAVAPPAQAVSDVFRVDGTSLVNSNTTKSATAPCPAGTKVYGAGAFIVDGNGKVTLERVLPDLSLTQVSATATENGAFAGDWRVVAEAICGTPVANLQPIVENSVSSSSTSKSVSPDCPAGTKLYGLGGITIGGTGRVVLDDFTPNAALSGAVVTAYENGTFTPNWSLTAYAICGNPAATMVRQVTNPPIPFDSTSPKSERSATCPAGTKVHGVGGEINGGVGSVVLEDLQFTAALTESTAKAYEVNAYASNWQVTSYVVCAS